MSYARNLQGLGASGDRFSTGQEVTARFTPHGVNAANQAGVFAQLGAAMSRTGAFKSPTYLGWGAAENAGLIVFKAPTKVDTFTARQIADKMPAVVTSINSALGTTRVSFVSLKHPVPTGPAVAAAAPAATPDDVSPSTTPPPVDPYAPPASPGAPAEEVGFFTRKVAGIPVWGIGAGVLVLGAGLVAAALFVGKKKPAQTALAANRRRARRMRRNFDPSPELRALMAEVAAEKAEKAKRGTQAPEWAVRLGNPGSGR